jgi:hypothetical protein
MTLERVFAGFGWAVGGASGLALLAGADFHLTAYFFMFSLLTACLVVTLADLGATILARRDLARAVAKSSPDTRNKLRGFLDVGDVDGAIAIISNHLQDLPPREQKQARGALMQSSRIGRQTYAQTVAVAAGLRG